MRMRFVCTLDEKDRIEIELGGNVPAVLVPLGRSDPIIGARLRAQLTEPVPLMMLLSADGDIAKNWTGPHANFMYRNQLIALTHIGSKTKEEVILGVKRFVLEREQRIERERARVAILELTAPPAEPKE
jgi:hypothetical protein